MDAGWQVVGHTEETRSVAGGSDQTDLVTGARERANGVLQRRIAGRPKGMDAQHALAHAALEAADWRARERSGRTGFLATGFLATDFLATELRMLAKPCDETAYALRNAGLRQKPDGIEQTL